jgi:hypothetical protein
VFSLGSGEGDGTVEFHVDDEVYEGTSGTFVLVPAGSPHTFGNTSDEPARLLVLHAPALDGYFADLEQLWVWGAAARQRSRAGPDASARHGAHLTPGRWQAADMCNTFLYRP